MPYGLKPTPSTWQSSKRILTGRLVTLRFPCQHDVSMMSATGSISSSSVISARECLILHGIHSTTSGYIIADRIVGCSADCILIAWRVAMW
eukprot:COSAG06_NODE_432_length_15846_cov_18.957325_10_plen_91_part_00